MTNFDCCVTLIFDLIWPLTLNLWALILHAVSTANSSTNSLKFYLFWPSLISACTSLNLCFMLSYHFFPSVIRTKTLPAKPLPFVFFLNPYLRNHAQMSLFTSSRAPMLSIMSLNLRAKHSKSPISNFSDHQNSLQNAQNPQNRSNPTKIDPSQEIIRLTSKMLTFNHFWHFFTLFSNF